MDSTFLDPYAVVFVCDVPRISVRLADALAHHVKAADAAARLIWVLGPSVDGASYNQTLLPRNLLPGPLASPIVTAAGSTIDWVDLQSDIFANLFDNQEPFRAVVVTGRWSMNGNGRALAKLKDGSAILMQHSSAAGAGEVYTILTSPSAAWSNLGSTVVLLPMACRLALGGSGGSKIPVSYECGDRVLIPVTGIASRTAQLTIDILMPNKEVFNAHAALSGNVRAWYFDHTATEGLYQWGSADQKSAGMFAVNPPAEEVDLSSANALELADEANLAGGPATGRTAIVAHSPEELLSQLQTRSEGTALAPGILGMVLILAVLEALLANRYRPASGVRADSKVNREGATDLAAV